MAGIRVAKDIYEDGQGEAFIKTFDAKGEAKITKVYNAKDTRFISFQGDLSPEQEEILNVKKI